MSPRERLSAVLDEPEVLVDVWPERPLRRQARYPSVRFQLLEATDPERKRWWTSFGAGTVIQAIILVLVVVLATVIPSAVNTPAVRRRYIMVSITLPPLPRPAQTTPSRKPVIAKPVAREIVKPRVVAPKPVFRPEIPSAVAMAKPAPKPIFNRPKVRAPVMRTEPGTRAVPKWKPKVAIGRFARNSPSPSAAQRPARSVQTGGFGNPHGLPTEVQATHAGNMTKLGTFAMADGPGHGNGSGGAAGARGLVASAGFGSADPPGSGASAGSSSGTVQSSGFGDASVRSQASATQPRQRMASSSQPVVILSKPNPAYTEEARRLHIQGEVVLDVVFAASGEVRVVRVVKGLGHGLDQSAIEDAREIRFRPAQRGGAPVDTTATLRILFQLAD